MRSKLSYLILFILSTPIICLSQGKRYIYYFDKDFKSIDKAHAVYTGIGIKDSGLLKLEVLYIPTMQLVSVDHYKVSTLAVYEGLSQNFYSNGNKASQGKYKNNVEEGLWENWDSTGRITDSIIYDHGRKVSESKVEYFGKKSYSYKLNDIKNNTEYKINYDDSGKIKSEVFFIGQKGIIKTYDNQGVKIDSIFSKEEIEASYPGGEAAWTRYLSGEISRNIDALTRDGRSGTCKVRFIVNKDGKVTNVKAITMEGTALAEVAIRALKNGPKWKPAMQYGRPVNAYREQPITFTIQNR